jgi:pimeloyl-ACP methyl ester carboxylesterase
MGSLVTAVVIAKRRRAARFPEAARRTGASANGMEFEVHGDGPRTLLYIPGGPGSEISTGIMAKMTSSQFAPYVRAGFTVWRVTRRRNMPQGHTIADMADDCAAFIETKLGGGPVDLVIGESNGGLIAQYLAANHPTLMKRVVLAISAGAISESGKDLDRRWATARAEGRHADAGAIFLEYVFPGDDRAALRERLGPIAGRLFAKSPVPAGDLLVEAEAEAAFDARGILPQIKAPVLLVCGDQDEFFSREIVEETAQLIPDSTVVWYEGMGHLRSAMNSRTAIEVLQWAGPEPAVAATA